MKTTIIIIITLSAALIAAAPAVFAQGVPSKTPGLQHGVSKKKHSGASVPVYALPREMRAKSAKNVYPRAFGYAPGDAPDRETEMSRQAGGGGGGGGSGM